MDKKANTTNNPYTKEKCYVPDFLRYLLENDIRDEEFTTSYAQKSGKDIPLWWQRDIPIGLTKKERKKEQKRQIEYNKYLKRRLIAGERLKKQYITKIKNQEDAFRQKVAQNQSLIEIKMEEMELASRENAQRLDQEFIEREAKLSEAVRERKRWELLLKNEEVLQAWQLDIQKRIDELKGKIDKVDNAIQKENLKTQEIKEKYQEIKGENEKIGDRSQLSQPPQYHLKNLFIPRQYEEFDNSNIIELKDIYFKKREEERFFLKEITVSVKRDKVNILLTDKDEKIRYIKQVLSRNYGSDMHITQGVVRIDGKEAGTVPKTEYKDTFGSYMLSLSEITDVLYSSRQSIKQIYKGEINESMWRAYCHLFDLPASKMYSARLSKLDTQTINTLALVVNLASKQKVAVLEFPKSNLKNEVLETLISYLSSGSVYKTIWVMTTSMEMASSIKNASVYRI